VFAHIDPQLITVERLLDPGYVVNLPGLSLSELRRRRSECGMVESSLSFERQLVQGWLDIVRDEQGRREEREAAEDASLIERLPAILTSHVRTTGAGRPPTFTYPLHGEREHLARMHSIVPVGSIANLAVLSDLEMGTISEVLLEIEGEVSTLRRALNAVYDRLQSEAIRRYTSGEEAVISPFRATP
jgi:hypothetical protein